LKQIEIEPFEDDYNIHYKFKYFSKNNNKSTENLLKIQNLKTLQIKNNIKTKNQNSSNKLINKNSKKIFLTNNDTNIKEKFHKKIKTKNFVYKEILSDIENKHVNEIPLIYIEKKRRNKSFSSKKIIKSLNENDIFNGMTEKQFLYQISHYKNFKNKISPLKFIKENGLKIGCATTRNNNELENKNIINIINKKFKFINYSSKNLH
jgi:hypothetical protein